MTNPDKFDIVHAPDRLTIFLSSSMDNIERVDKETKLFLAEKGLMSESFAICLGMREGLTNAIKHGHHYNQTKTVTFLLLLEESKLIMEIEDQGAGFNWKNIHNMPPVIESEHGRGISIIKEYFDEYQFNEKGNKIILTKYITK